MPYFNNPQPQKKLPKFHEGSRLKSPRDSDSIGRVWSKNKTIESQVASMSENLKQVIQELNRIRIRKGSSGEETATSVTPRWG